VFGFGPAEMMIVFIIVLLIFGPSQLPKLAKGLGNAMREFRKAQHLPRTSPSSSAAPETGWAAGFAPAAHPVSGSLAALVPPARDPVCVYRAPR